MDGVITDDARQPLRPEMIDTIGADLERLYDTLDAHDLAAGSAQARRLFSDAFLPFRLTALHGISAGLFSYEFKST
jgi:hypothetical protein